MIISALFAMSYFVGYRIISQSYNKLLYQSIAGSLRYGSARVEKLMTMHNRNMMVTKLLIGNVPMI